MAPQKLLRTGCSQNLDICLYRYHRFQWPDRIQAVSLFLIYQGVHDWLAKYYCLGICMESTEKCWIPVFNILEKTCRVTLAHPKYTKPQKGNKTNCKDAK